MRCSYAFAVWWIVNQLYSPQDREKICTYSIYKYSISNKKKKKINEENS